MSSDSDRRSFSTISNNKKNKHVLITGGNQGIGLHTALALADRGGHDITLACRNRERAEAAVRQIRDKNWAIQVGWLPLDLASLGSVQALLELVRQRGIVFDAVILNAGILLPPAGSSTEDGLEPTFQVNFLGHFLLAEGIVAHQCPQHPLQVVTLTSVLHKLVGPLFPVEKEPAKWAPMFASARRWRAYALSKFATALLAQHLNQQPGVRAVAVHPGAVRTQMAQSVSLSPRKRKFLFFLKRLMIEPEVAAQNVLRCLNLDDNEKQLLLAPGQYMHQNKAKKCPAAVCKPRNLDALVRMSRQLTAPFQSWTTACLNEAALTR